MGLIVQKFGGTSVADRVCIYNVANIIARRIKEGYDVVTVVGHFEMWIKDRTNTGRENNGKPKFMQKTIADSIILK